jgi:hypothetical protein
VEHRDRAAVGDADHLADERLRGRQGRRDEGGEEDRQKDSGL